MNNNLLKAVEMLSSREGYYLPIIKAKIFRDIEKTSDSLPLSQLIIEHKNGIWGQDFIEDGVEVKVLRSPDFRHGFIDVDNAEKRFVSRTDYDKHKLVFGDILVIKSNGSQDLVGKSQLFDVHEEYIIPSNFVLRLRPDLEKVDPYYLDLFLKSPQSLMWRVESQTTTTGLRNLKTKEYLGTKVPLPSLQIQKFVVNFYKSCVEGHFEQNALFVIEEYKNIYQLINELELLNSNIEKQYAIVQKIKQSILQDAIQGKLVKQDENDEPASVLLEKIRQEKERLIKEKKIKKEKPLPPIKDEEKPFDLPKGWEWVRLRDITAKIGSGSTPRGGKDVYVESGVKFIRSQNVWNDGLKLNDIVYIPEQINEKMKGTIVKPRDLLLNITGASIGRCCIVPTSFDIGNVNQHVSIIRLIDNQLVEYVHYCLISRYIQDIIMSTQVGISREGLSIAKLSEFLIPIPPLGELKRIVEKVRQLMSLCDELEKSIEGSKQQSENLMKAVLQEAFTIKEQETVDVFN